MNIKKDATSATMPDFSLYINGFRGGRFFSFSATFPPLPPRICLLDPDAVIEEQPHEAFRAFAFPLGEGAERSEADEVSSTIRPEHIKV